MNFKAFFGKFDFVENFLSYRARQFEKHDFEKFKSLKTMFA